MKRVNWGHHLAALPGVVMFPQRRLTYLDSNAVSDLSRWQERRPELAGRIEKVRRDLRSFGTKRRIVVSQWLFSELAFMEVGGNPNDFAADREFLDSLHYPLLFTSSLRMMQREVAAFYSREVLNPFVSAEFPMNFAREEWRQLRVDERTSVEEAKTEFLRSESESQQVVDTEYPDKADRVRKLSADWAADRDGILMRWVRTKIGQQLDRLHIPEQGPRPQPKDVLTLWCSWAFRITRTMLREIRHPRKSKGSEFVDWCHYMSAAHAHEFVTSDDWLLKIAAEAPGPKPAFFRLEDWIQLLLSEGQ